MKLNIRTKLLLAFSLILILSSAVNIYGLFQMERLADLTTKIYNHPLQVTRAVLTANAEIINMHSSMKDIALAKSEADIKAAHSQIEQSEQEVNKQLNIVRKWILGKAGATLIAETIQTFGDWSPIREEVIALKKAEKWKAVVAITKGKAARHVAMLNQQMEALKNYAASKASGMYEDAQATQISVVTATIIALVVVFILSALLGVFISLGIANSIQIINIIANKMVAGEITSIVKNRAEVNKVIASGDEIGEIGRAFYAVAIYFNTVIDDIVQVSQGLAKGNLRIMPKASYQGDFTQIKKALEMALPSQRQIVEDIIQVSQGIAEGNLKITSQVEYKGDFVKVKTTLEKTLSDLRRVIEDVVQVSQGLAVGEKRVMAAEYQGDFIQIKNALETAALKMSETTTLNKTQDWLKTGQTQLNQQMSGDQEITQLAKNIITFLATYLEMSIGMFYLLEESKSDKKTLIKLTASYAYTHRKGISNAFTVGEGLVGQAALEKKEILITKVPDNYYIRIQSGLGQALPRNVIIQPFMYEDTLKGVIELASFKTISNIQREFLKQIMSNIGIAVNTAESRSSMRILLEQSQQQAEELQTQSEELQSQSEELTQTNEELEMRTQDLEKQKEDVRQKNLVLEKTQTEMEKTREAIETKAKELELASKYKSEFLANMSHELRTPLNSLLILGQLLMNNKTGNLTEKQVEYAKTIHSAGSDLLTLINEILDLSKVEAGKIEVHVENVSLSELVEAVEQKFRHVAENKGLAFHVAIDDDIPSVLSTDAQRLKQVINNLLSNAFKFTSKGEIRLTAQPATNTRMSQSGDLSIMDFDPAKTIAISVSDTGIGIPKNKQQVIFEAFQQVDGTTSRKYGGTGLGLSISRQLARLLGGELTLETEEGKGSIFTLYLPIEKAIAEESTKPSLSEATPKGDKADKAQSVVSTAVISTKLVSQDIQEGTSTISQTAAPKDNAPIADDRYTLQRTDQSILIIEDDRKFSRILMELAHEKGFKYLIAEDGKIGLQLAEEYHPQAIILDVGLPQLDGWSVMERLKDNPKTRHIPVHFMSASDEDMDAKRMGAIGYLHKPVNLNDLGNAFKKIEGFISKTVKTVLLLVDHKTHQQQFLDLIEGKDIETTVAKTIASALQHLKKASFDCLIFDMDIEQGAGSQLLERMQKEPELYQIPVIVYAERELSQSEETLLLKCANHIPIKSVKSPERLLDEAALFLHQVEANMSENKRKMIRMVHDKEAILKDKRVLIVDDDVRNVFALATALEEKDMEIVAAKDGKEALAKLEQHKDIAIILMDIMMPEMDGYEAMQEIRKHPKSRHLPIIALTAKAMKGDKAKCIEAGANDYLSKPVDTEKLLSLMRVWLYR